MAADGRWQGAVLHLAIRAAVAVTVVEPHQGVILQVLYDGHRRDGGLPAHISESQPMQRYHSGEQQELRDIGTVAGAEAYRLTRQICRCNGDYDSPGRRSHAVQWAEGQSQLLRAIEKKAVEWRKDKHHHQKQAVKIVIEPG